MHDREHDIDAEHGISPSTSIDTESKLNESCSGRVISHLGSAGIYRPNGQSASVMT